MLARLRRPHLPVLVADALNRWRYGHLTPLKFQTLWVRPAEIAFRVDSGPGSDAARSAELRRQRQALRRRPSVIFAGDWDLRRRPLLPNPLMDAIRARCNDGVDWRSAGAHAILMERIRRDGVVDGCRTEEDIMARYAALDLLIEACRVGEGIVPRARIDSRAFRESGGIAVGVARDGTLLFTGSGYHRLFVAQHFELARMPVCVCAVHPLAIRDGAWQRLSEASVALSATEKSIAPAG
jgi:hypothetical protein